MSRQAEFFGCELHWRKVSRLWNPAAEKRLRAHAAALISGEYVNQAW